MCYRSSVVSGSTISRLGAILNIDLLYLTCETRLKNGEDVIVELTGLRNPRHQIDKFQSSLLKHCVEKTANKIVRRVDVMGIVAHGGIVRPGNAIDIELPAHPHKPIEYMANCKI